MNTQHAHVSGRPAARAPLDLFTQPRLRGGTLLLVEDSRLSSDAIRLMFRGADGRMRRADTLCSARRHLSLYTPDAVLIDLGLPDGTGLDLIAEVAHKRPRVPLVIAMSGHPGMDAAAQAAGADRFLAKPFQGVAQFRAILAPIFFPLHTPPLCEGAPEANATALRDDLHLAIDLLCGTAQSGRRDYAMRFIEGLARSLPDAALLESVTRARASGRASDLVVQLRQRLRDQPLI